jgi:hypothetical protein
MKDSLHFDKTDEKLKEVREQLVTQFKKVLAPSPPSTLFFTIVRSADNWMAYHISTLLQSQRLKSLV